MLKPGLIKEVFFRRGLSKAVLYWQLFCLSLATSVGSHGEGFERLKIEAPQLDDAQLLVRWLAQHKAYDAIAVMGTWLVPFLAGLMGILAIAGACTYSGVAPINLWLMLGLFAGLPFIMTAVAAWSWYKTLSHSSYGGFETILLSFLKRYLLKPLWNDMAVESMSYNKTIKLWLLFKLQSAALSFQLCIVLGFIIILLFKDLSFAWSSTIVTEGETMVHLIRGFAWPWHWFLSAPSADFIAKSQFYHGGGMDAKHLGQWWNYILLAMLCYGVLPRLILIIAMRQQLIFALNKEIKQSDQISYLLNSVRHVTDSVDEGEALSSIAIKHINIDQKNNMIAWQWQPAKFSPAQVLGLSNWEEDEQWVKEHADTWQEQLIILINPQQTPTAELMDFIALIRTQDKTVNIELAIVIDDPDIQSGTELKQFKEQGLYQSWALFAQKNLLLLSAVKRSSVPKSSNV